MPRSARSPRAAELAARLAALLAASLAATAVTTPALAEAKKPDPLPPPDPSFVVMEPIDAPIVDSGRLDGVLHVSITVKTKSAANAAELAKRMPELRAASLAAAIEFARLHASPYTPVNVARLSAMMAPPIKRLDKGIEKVLIVKVSADEG
ncbi:hypothetical protein EDF57_103458 [Novosphingobium sp. PhB55]|uniref:hypothetical protein n=1 Tax=Novosphingobium sp. PhB55 TaxID=2485106 RepID=UPI0010669DA4|nr:hypothetical protein [Novosphingobium sp. PhB55]TDW65275.1 hypothetical protein EDF57_103458 [Novosphingobium sp. PhB55]